MLRPLGQRVVVQLAAKEEKTAGGLVLPGASKDKQQHGEILAVSEAIAKSKEVSIGDKVVVDAYAGVEVKHDGLEVLVIDLEHVLAILD